MSDSYYQPSGQEQLLREAVNRAATIAIEYTSVPNEELRGEICEWQQKALDVVSDYRTIADKLPKEKPRRE